ncbi:MAG TPA: single-stranded-DNA-specific exonuclease RecJ [Solirubrobacterales bacterium]|nr:single-stranded-DNA-specific exonuclease RecJ [Solirubrobacterales bacterium]
MADVVDAETIKAYRAEPYSYAEARVLAEELGLSEPVAITLVRRGYRTPEAARTFLDADESHPPNAFRSMGAVVETVSAAIQERRRITVHGDFDVDGVCATTILVGTLRELGAECDWLIPDRIADGYGLSASNIELLAERGTQLLITVDCGITAVEEVALARSLGMEVIVTDHHQPGDELPDCPILHPAVDGYPFESLCGTAVAWKLACALRAASGAGSPGSLSRGVPGDPAPDAAGRTQPGDSTSKADLDLVALATVADVVPLVGENRSLVRRGLAEVRRARRPGIRALLEAAKCEPSQLDEGDLAFRLAPRINAAGRLYRADAGVELFLTDDEERAAEIAVELSRANGERRATEREVDTAVEAARRELPDELREAPGLVVAGEGWHPGVIGIVASRLAERHHRPVVVISLDGEGGGRGSGRSIPGFDLLAALQACAEHLTSFGGHRAAAGLELRAEDVDAFRAAFAAHATAVLGPEDLRRTERIDAMVGGADLGLDLAEELQRLAPFGMGNPGVRLLVPSARVRDVRTMGEGKHARFSLHSGAHRALGVAFGRSKLGVGEEDPVDAAVRLEVNRWNGSVEPRVVLRELYPRAVGESELSPSATGEWWERFEAELRADLEHWPPDAPELGEGEGRTLLRPRSSPAAVIAELTSSGGGDVLAVVADRARRAALAGQGVELADGAALEADPELASGFEHVVLVDPPQFAHLERLAIRPAGAGGYAHLAWGDAEHRFALTMLDEQLARRSTLISLFRDLREAGNPSGAGLLEALRGSGPHPRGAETAARCLRVLIELDLVQGNPDGGDGSVGVVSSEGTELERSPAFRAYGARHQEGLQYLKRRKQP